jgi:acyl-CoA synthetase (NDP forming)
LLGVFLSKESAPRIESSEGARVPHYPFPEDAARALSLAAHYSAWRAIPEEPPTELDGIDRDRAAGVIATALAGGDGWMASRGMGELLACYGIPVVETRFADSPAAAGREARDLGVPVALKAVVPGLLHKSDVGAVRLDLDGEPAVRRAATEMSASLEQSGHHVAGFEVQPIAPKGVEMLVGVVQDQHFGPVLACGAGGTATELVKDVAVRITPITAGEASRMVRSLKTFPLLDGYRGAAKVDVSALEDVLIRVSAMVEAHAEVAEMDLNPLIAGPSGAVVVDARVRLERGTPKRPVGAR